MTTDIAQIPDNIRRPEVAVSVRVHDKLWNASLPPVVALTYQRIFALNFGVAYRERKYGRKHTIGV